MLWKISEQIEVKMSDIKNEISFEGQAELLALLVLEDDQFSVMAPVILKLLEDECSKPEVRTSIMREGANRPFISPEKYRETLKEEIGDELSDVKLDFLTAMYALTYNIVIEGKKEYNVAVAIERCHPDAMLPTYASIGDAGMDVYAIEDVTILPGETKLIKTGIKVAIPDGYELQVRPRSGQSLKTKLRVANSPGTIDSGYRDEIGIIMENIASPIQELSFHYDENNNLVIDNILTSSPEEIVKGQRIAQLVLTKVYHTNFYKCDNVKELGGDRGGGFGHSGK